MLEVVVMFRRSHLTTVAALILIAGCADQQSTAPRLSRSSTSTVAARRGGSISAAVDQTIGGSVISGTLSITRLAVSSTGQLLASGVLSGTVDGTPFTQSFTDVPATLNGAGAGTATATTTAVRVTQQSSATTCDILFLDLGPLHLDVLGLTVDLNEVVLDVAAQAGAGNLLGNLLCTVVHLLDIPGALAALANILNQINTILAAL
jgi:hypothetical protein